MTNIKVSIQNTLAIFLTATPASRGVFYQHSIGKLFKKVEGKSVFNLLTLQL